MQAAYIARRFGVFVLIIWLAATLNFFLPRLSGLDFNYSIANYPRTVRELIADALPWTLGLLGTTTLLSFVIGTLLGALLAWPRAPRWMLWLMPPLWALHAIPFFLLGLILTYFFAFQLPLLPIFGGYSPGAVPALNWGFAWDVLSHALLPALSIILVATGGWAL